MKYYISSIIPKIQKFSKQLDEDVLLLNHQWVCFNESELNKATYIFRPNKDLIISENGKGIRAKWESLGNQTILIEVGDEILLFKTSFFDETALVLNLHDTDTYAFFLNETKIGKTFKNLAEINLYLEEKYSKEPTDSYLSNITNGNIDGINYTESLPKNENSFSLGEHQVITITFSNGRKGIICKGGNSQKYFYEDFLRGLVYGTNKDDCIRKMYGDLIHNR